MRENEKKREAAARGKTSTTNMNEATRNEKDERQETK